MGREGGGVRHGKRIPESKFKRIYAMVKENKLVLWHQFSPLFLFSN